MWSAIITSAATIAAVLYLQGPIVALGLTAISSIALLIVLRASEQHAQAEPKTVSIAPGKDGDADLNFPPLRQAS